MPRASLTVVPGAGHHLYLDNPAAFHAAVREGLREREGGGG
jgi:pimeloyl-ACP methyl ester carboxylesterase